MYMGSCFGALGALGSKQPTAAVQTWPRPQAPMAAPKVRAVRGISAGLGLGVSTTNLPAWRLTGRSNNL